MHKLFSQMENYALQEHIPIINERGKKVFIELIQKYNPCNVLEIGTAIGYSALLIAHYSKHNPHITSLELDSERIYVATEFIRKSPYGQQITMIPGDANESLAELLADKTNLSKFDFIFIDAAKGQYPRYLEQILPLLSPQGVIIADNVLFRGYVLSNNANVPRRYKTIVKRLREYLNIVEDNNKFQTTIYEHGDGLAETTLVSKEN